MQELSEAGRGIPRWKEIEFPAKGTFARIGPVVRAEVKEVRFSLLSLRRDHDRASGGQEKE